MPRTMIAITLEVATLERIDRLVALRLYPSRSRVIEAAVAERTDRLGRRRLARECAKLDPKFEHALAEEGLSKVREAWRGY